MDITVYPGLLKGTIEAIASKSQAHRALICAAFADRNTTIICNQLNEDIEATALCLQELGATIQRTQDGYIVHPIKQSPQTAKLDCRESGSTLRFMLPVAGALGIDVTFQLSGRLPNRPLSPLWEEMERMGCRLSRPTANTIRCQGKLSAGTYYIDGGVSSQFITGLLLALPLIHGDSHIHITGDIESLPYIHMTQQVMQQFGVNTQDLNLKGCQPFSSPGTYTVEGDWSNAAFFLAANCLGNQVQVEGLNHASLQGDMACKEILSSLTKTNATVYCKDIPDLVPILSVVAAHFHGATFHQISRLRLKESDRVQTVLDMLHGMGIHADAAEHSMHIPGGRFSGCIVDSANDHRIAMATAIAATVASDPVTILGADCVKKSYPSFWNEFRRLGGHYEQYIR